MNNRNFSDEEILSELNNEYEKDFKGWDFSEIEKRMKHLGSLPWDYEADVCEILKKAESLLDIDTGGGEVLARMLSKSGFKGDVSAIESYIPNIQVARNCLNRFNVKVYDASSSPANFPDDRSDLITDRHGGSLLADELFRILKPGGWFVTQQVGDRTNLELQQLFDVEKPEYGGLPNNKSRLEKALEDAGFDAVEVREHFYPIRFNDAGVLVYYLKAIPFEVPGFSINQYADILIELYRQSMDRGYAIDTTWHSVFAVARKPQNNGVGVKCRSK